jgi:pimeloyl-ACP methyl ester carboxylesterase
MPQEIINGYNMYYEVHGQGEPLVMIHGGLGGGEGCATMVENFASSIPGFQMIFYDRRAAGLSETPQDGYSMANQVQDMQALLQRLGVGRAHVLGSSGGGPIALGAALDHPEIVDTLLLVNTMSYASHPERDARQKEMDDLISNEATYGREGSVERGLEFRNPGIREDDPGRFQRLKEVNLEKFPGMIGSMKAYLDIGDSIESRLSSLKMPTMIVHGDADTRIPVECGQRLHEGIPGSELHVIPGAVHGLTSNEAPKLQGLMLDFFQRTKASRQPSASRTS